MSASSFGKNVVNYGNPDQLAANNRVAEMEAQRHEAANRDRAFIGYPISNFFDKDGAKLSRDFLSYMATRGYPGSVVVSPRNSTAGANVPGVRGYPFGVIARPIQVQEHRRPHDPIKVANVAPLILCEDGTVRLEDGSDITHKVQQDVMEEEGTHVIIGAVESSSKRIQSMNMTVATETISPQSLQHVLYSTAATHVPQPPVVPTTI